MASRARPMVWFYVLMVYVCLQFLWWAWLIFDSNRDIHALQLQVLELQPYPALEFAALKAELDAKLRTKVWMVLGEGSVFLLLLFWGLFRVRAAFRKETNLLQQQRNFLLSVTHELKTPLASVKLYLQTLQARKLEAEKEKQVLGNALAQADRLNQLVENILLATSIENQSYHVQPQPGDLSAFIKQQLAQSASLSNETHTLKTELQAGVTARFDALAVTSILENLLENAVKYAPSGSTITVSVRNNSGQSELLVADEGPGIPAAQKQKVFEKFYRAGSEETRTAKGTGLGLYIVKELAKQQEAHIELRQGSNGGAIFAVRFKAT